MTEIRTGANGANGAKGASAPSVSIGGQGGAGGEGEASYNTGTGVDVECFGGHGGDGGDGGDPAAGGFAGGAGGDGGAGGESRPEIFDATRDAGDLDLIIRAYGGHGGDGGQGIAGSAGAATGGAGGDGGDGGYGGDAGAAIGGTSVQGFGQGDTFNFIVEGFGGDGGDGGDAGAGGLGDVRGAAGRAGSAGAGGHAWAQAFSDYVPIQAGGGTVDFRLRAVAGDGGDGGDGALGPSSQQPTAGAAGGAGGTAGIRWDAPMIGGSAVADDVILSATALGGLGGRGGAHGNGNEVFRAADGDDGAASITLTRGSVALGAGDDRLTLDLVVSTGGTVKLGEGFNVANSFQGGAGFDVLQLAGGTLDRESGVLTERFVLNMQTNIVAGFERVIGTAGDDAITGAGQDDWLEGGLGDDFLRGGAGADTAGYSDASGSIVLALHRREAVGADGVDTLWDIENASGSAFADTLEGTLEHNWLSGGAGNDRLVGYDGWDTLLGGDGDDRLDGGRHDNTLDGGAGADTMLGGQGVDVVTYARAAAAVQVDLALKVQADGDIMTGIENLVGSAGGDLLRGNRYDNRLDGGEGSDTLYGGDGKDQLVGGAGNDTVSYLGAGRGVVVSLASTARQMTIGGGKDTLSNVENLIGSAYADSLRGDGGGNRLEGGEGADTLAGGLGADVLAGGAGIDLADFAGAAGGISVDLGAGAQQTGEGLDTFVDIENLQGSGFNDTLAGSGAANLLLGGAGDDALSGADGGDSLAGGKGADTLDGGAGIDTASYADAGAGVTISLALAGGQAAGDLGVDTLVDVENLVGSASGDRLSGNDLANWLDGGAGADTLEGGLGNDELIGGRGVDTASYLGAAARVTVDLANLDAQQTRGAGVDRLDGVENLAGSQFADRLSGDAGANRLDGGAGADELFGGLGDDVLAGGLGVDDLTGGAGADRFLFTSLADIAVGSADLIHDLEAGDIVDLRAIDAGDRAGNQAFQLVAAFSGAGGEATLSYQATRDLTLLHLDVDGDMEADAVIRFDGDQTGFGGLLL